MEKTSNFKKNPNNEIHGFILIVMLLLGLGILFMPNSTQTNETKTFENLDTISFPGLGTIQTVSVDNDSVLLHFYIVDDKDGIRYDVRKMAKHKLATKDYLKYSIEYMHLNEDFKKIVDYALSNNKWLMWNIEGTNSKRKVSIGLSPTELNEAALGNIYKANDNRQIESEKAEVVHLKMPIKAENMILPMKISDAIMWTNASVDEYNVIYTYTIDDVNYIVDKKALRQDFNGIIMDNIQNLPHFLCSITDRGIRCVYKYKSGNEGFEEICTHKQIFDYEMKNIDEQLSDK